MLHPLLALPSIDRHLRRERRITTVGIPITAIPLAAPEPDPAGDG
jgi:hypothetical protein